MIRRLIIKGEEDSKMIGNNNQNDFISAFANAFSDKNPLLEIKQAIPLNTQVHMRTEYRHRPSKSEVHSINTDCGNNLQMQAAIETEENYKILQAFLDQLGYNCREILIRYYWKRESIEEIGQALNINKDSAINSKYQCMEQLHKLIYGKSKC